MKLPFLRDPRGCVFVPLILRMARDGADFIRPGAVSADVRNYLGNAAARLLYPSGVTPGAMEIMALAGTIERLSCSWYLLARLWLPFKAYLWRSDK